MNLRIEFLNTNSNSKKLSTPSDYINAWTEGHQFISRPSIEVWPARVPVSITIKDTPLLRDLGYTNIAIQMSGKVTVFLKL